MSKRKRVLVGLGRCGCAVGWALNDPEDPSSTRRMAVSMQEFLEDGLEVRSMTIPEYDALPQGICDCSRCRL